MDPKTKEWLFISATAAELQDVSTPRKLATEAVEHFKRAAHAIDIPNDDLKQQERRAREAIKHRRVPTLPKIAIPEKENGQDHS